MRAAVRPEYEIMRDLEQLAGSPGYLHAIAFVCFRDNFISYAADVTPAKLASLYSTTRLIRTEISTMIGLALKHPIDWSLPDPSILQGYVERTEVLLLELHDALNAPMVELFKKGFGRNLDEGEDPFSSGAVLREPIFYGAESAYTFQYRDFSTLKYGRDDPWLIEKKGFSIAEARAVVQSIGVVTAKTIMATFESFLTKHPDEWSVLPAFELDLRAVASESRVAPEIAKLVLDAFSLPDRPQNEAFCQLNDFNVYNAYPIIRRQTGAYVCLQQNSLLEALYETPFYWMLSDREYADQATVNRGCFLERLSQQRLERVFGPGRVWSNVLIIDQHGERAAEIDTLVVFGNRAIVVQAKAKRMTLAARSGNDKMTRMTLPRAYKRPTTKDCAVLT